jgi:hypothetical protein
MQVIDLAGDAAALLALQRRFRSKFPVLSLLPGNCPHGDPFGKTASTTRKSTQTHVIFCSTGYHDIPAGANETPSDISDGQKTLLHTPVTGAAGGPPPSRVPKLNHTQRCNILTSERRALRHKSQEPSS